MLDSLEKIVKNSYKDYYLSDLDLFYHGREPGESLIDENDNIISYDWIIENTDDWDSDIDSSEYDNYENDYGRIDYQIWRYLMDMLTEMEYSDRIGIDTEDITYYHYKNILLSKKRINHWMD